MECFYENAEKLKSGKVKQALTFNLLLHSYLLTVKAFEAVPMASASKLHDPA
jgi:hypothetical protein